MSKLAREAERLKLARLLEREPADLAFVNRLPAPAITALRRSILASLYESHDALFERMARAGRLLPMALMAKVAEKAIGPWLCARVAGHMPVDRAVEMATRLPVAFLADTCLEIDPRRVRPLLQRIPLRVMRSVAAELVHRRDFITLGRFVDDLADEAAEAVMADISDEGILLEIAFFAEDRQHLAHVVRRLSDERKSAAIRAAQEQGLWSRAIALMNYVDDELCMSLGDLAAAEDDALLTGMLEAIDGERLWADALPVVARMSAAARRRILALPVIDSSDMLRSALETARDLDLWGEIETVVADSPNSVHERAEALLERMTDVPEEVPARLRELRK